MKFNLRIAFISNSHKAKGNNRISFFYHDDTIQSLKEENQMFDSMLWMTFKLPLLAVIWPANVIVNKAVERHGLPEISLTSIQQTGI